MNHLNAKLAPIDIFTARYTIVVFTLENNKYLNASVAGICEPTTWLLKSWLAAKQAEV